MPAPNLLRIPYEDDQYGRFTTIGWLPDGTQFMAFVTGAFPTNYKYSSTDWRTKKRWLAVVHRFDRAGNHIGSESRVGGFDIGGHKIACDKALEHLKAMMAQLMQAGAPDFCDVWVKPFAIELEGVTHGLFYEHGVEEHDDKREEYEYVMLQPHDIMFHPPWDSGEYST